MRLEIKKKAAGYILKIVNGDSNITTHFYPDLLKLCFALWINITVKNFTLRPVLFRTLESAAMKDPKQLSEYLNIKFLKRLPAAGLELEIPVSDCRFFLKDESFINSKLSYRQILHR